MKFTVNDVLRNYFIRLDDEIERYNIKVEQDKEMIEEDPNDTFFKWEEVLIDDQKKLKEYKEKKEKLKNYLTNNWEKLQEMEIR